MNTQEKEAKTVNGWYALGILAVIVVIGLGCLAAVGIYWLNNASSMAALIQRPKGLLFTTIGAVVGIVLLGGFLNLARSGFFVLQPNEAAVLTLFGRYVGTVKESGFHWTNPLYSVQKVSQRIHNFASEQLKVNDLRGNPIEIAAIVVWRVENAAQSTFDVINCRDFVRVQTESALRHLAMAYPYDAFEGEALSLQGSTDEISDRLLVEVQEHVEKAGVQILDARLSHLAYAEEIAGAMLQRQQADAIVAARSRIVDGAVGMVEMALEKLEAYGKLELDEERKAAMVSNLLVVLCGHEGAHPVVNTGSLYT